MGLGHPRDGELSRFRRERLRPRRELGPWAKDEDGLERPLFRRHGFWVLAIGATLYLPALGVFSVWDPWETHYGEVAREILARNDWISLGGGLKTAGSGRSRFSNFWIKLSLWRPSERTTNRIA